MNIFNIKDIQNIILDYKIQLDFSEHKEKMKTILFSIKNLDIHSGQFFGRLVCTYYLCNDDTNEIITRTEFTFKGGMRINLRN